MKIVLDTNILLVSIPRKSEFRLIFDKFLARNYDLIISNEIINEYHEIISQKANSIVANNITELLLSSKNVYKQEIYFQWNIIVNDRDDNKFVDCAVAGNADYIVTNDKHFNIIKQIKFPPLQILNINEFMAILNDN